MDGTGQNRGTPSGNVNGAEAISSQREDRGFCCCLFFFFNVCMDAVCLFVCFA